MQTNSHTYQHSEKINTGNRPSCSDYLPERFNVGYQHNETCFDPPQYSNEISNNSPQFSVDPPQYDNETSDNSPQFSDEMADDPEKINDGCQHNETCVDPPQHVNEISDNSPQFSDDTVDDSES